jgi:hypothetical protein
MPKPDKKALERYFIETLKRNLSDFPSGKIVDCESPDFLLQTSDRVIGVEVTRLYGMDNESSVAPQLVENEHENVVMTAQSIAESNGLPPLMVDVYFDHKELITKSDRKLISEQLLAIVSHNIPELNKRTSIENNGQPFPAQVKAISIRRPRPLKSHLWQTAGGGIVNENFADQLQREIDKKNLKISEYRKRCDDCWLLVVADWTGPSAFFGISDEMRNIKYKALFNRVYFLEGGSEQITQLNIALIDD